MSRTGIRSCVDLPPPSARRVAAPSRGDGWNILADVEVFVFAVAAELEAMGHRQVDVSGPAELASRGRCWRGFQAAAATPLMSALISNAHALAARYSLAVTWPRWRWKRLLI